MAKPWPLNWLEPTSSRQLYHLLLQWQYSLPRWSSSPMLPPTDSMAVLKLSECPLLLKAGCLKLGMYLSHHLLNYSEPLAPLMLPICAIQKHNNLCMIFWIACLAVLSVDQLAKEITPQPFGLDPLRLCKQKSSRLKVTLTFRHNSWLHTWIQFCLNFSYNWTYWLESWSEVLRG